ncbi:hypothetical protein FF36_01409 [Frankia torreyi]|uniref:Uncharacterized protein n=1 Tax=Frankia torreyi TaxID=1856 RepID=A0A0D8BJZ8_9ACTN|nr:MULTISPECIES: hypothetical protein [Frankia]KJE24334.1 hypothetical protein FF36_01409 [Frankia torreyi]KQM06790.1 hypothetical protein FF86_100643 [Frankia sp. CpI1-P]
MEQDQLTQLTSGLSGPGPRDTVPGTVDAVEVTEITTEKIAFGSVANPKRLRLGASRAL